MSQDFNPAQPGPGEPGYQPPAPGYQPPPPGYQPPPAGYQAPPPGYQAPAPGYQAPGYPPPAGPVPLGDKPVVTWVVLGAGVLAILGSFMSWVTVTAPIMGNRSVSGIEGWDGWFTLFMGVVLAAWAAWSMRGQSLPSWAPRVAAAAAVALLLRTIWNIFDVQSAKTQMQESLTGANDPLGIGAQLIRSVEVSVGPGLYLLLLAGLAGTAAMAIKLLRGTRASA